VSNPNADELSKRIASLEGRFASSWACQTREEYEKAIKQDLKQEIIGYLVKISVGLLIFLGGAGTVLINLMIQSTYQRENAAMIKDLRARYDAHVNDDRTRLEWERFHNYGVAYRYLGELYSASPVPEDAKQKKLQDILDRAKTYYELALRTDPKQPTTYFELGQIYHTYPIKFGVPSWIRDQDAINEYQRAIDYFTKDDVSRGWRAQARTMLAEVELNGVGSKPDKASLDAAEKQLQQARAEYASAISEVSSYNREYSATNDKLLREVDCLRLPGSSATCTDVK
jgi:hypothetical protein